MNKIKYYLVVAVILLFSFLNVPSNKILIKHTYFTILYDTVLKVPFTTQYELDSRYLVSVVPRSATFKKDSLISPLIQFGDKDYLNSGYDKGHLFNDKDNRWSKKAEKECMLYTNVAPQNKAFNEHLWEAVEECERDSVSKYGHLSCYTGCLYDPSPKRIHNMPIPRVYWKVILYKGSFLAAWEGNNVTPKSFNPTTILVSKDSIEKETGLNF
jgi:endonuclease G